jgi:hypothetical protein
MYRCIDVCIDVYGACIHVWIERERERERERFLNRYIDIIG